MFRALPESSGGRIWSFKNLSSTPSFHPLASLGIEINGITAELHASSVIRISPGSTSRLPVIFRSPIRKPR